MEPWTASRASIELRTRLRDAAVDAARTAGADELLAKLLDVRCMTRWLAGDVAAAVADADEALAHADAARYPVARGFAHSARGVVLLHTGERRQEALADLAAARELAARHPDPALAAYVHIDSGALCRMNGDLEGSVEAFRAAVKVYREAGALRLEGLPLTFLAGAYAELGRFDDAVACYQRALSIQERCEDHQDWSMALAMCSSLYASQGNWTRARELATQALDKATRSGAFHSAVDARAQLATVALAAGEADAARTHAREALEGAQRLGNPYTEYRIRWHLAALEAEAGRLTEAEAEAARARALADAQPRVMERWELLGAFLDAARQGPEALARAAAQAEAARSFQVCELLRARQARADAPARA